LTGAPGDEAALARRAIGEGATTIAAVGGDGTWGAVASEIVSAGSGCRLALVARGSGNDFARSAGVPAHDLTAMARLAAGDGERRVDVGRIGGKYFLNVAGFGFDAAVLRKMAGGGWLRRRIPLRARYIAEALRLLPFYRPLDMEIESAGGGPLPGRLLCILFANGGWFGGGIPIAPAADPRDGALDMLAVADASLPRRLRILVSAARGRPMPFPEVAARPVARSILRFREPPVYEADGESCVAGSRVVLVECLPGALALAAGGNARGSVCGTAAI
jgi:diacylglycerol kinase (ATP)